MLEKSIWTLAKKYNLSNVVDHMSEFRTFDETGETDYSSLFLEIHRAAGIAVRFADQIDEGTSVRAGFRHAGWDPSNNPQKEAVDWVAPAASAANFPEYSSLKGLYGSWSRAVATYGQSDQISRFVIDQRGLNTNIVNEAETFLQPDDPRLRLNTIVTGISYSSDGVTVFTSDEACVTADYAICTFSVGALQNDIVEFSTPSLEPITGFLRFVRHVASRV